MADVDPPGREAPVRCMSGRCRGRRPVAVVVFGDLSESAYCARCYRHDNLYGIRPVIEVRAVRDGDTRYCFPNQRTKLVVVHSALPPVWSSAGWRLRAAASSLMVFTPCGRVAGEVLRRFDGRWVMSGVYPPGTTYRAVRNTAPAAVAALCAWWTSKDYYGGDR